MSFKIQNSILPQKGRKYFLFNPTKTILKLIMETWANWNFCLRFHFFSSIFFPTRYPLVLEVDKNSNTSGKIKYHLWNIFIWPSNLSPLATNLSKYGKKNSKLHPKYQTICQSTFHLISGKMWSQVSIQLNQVNSQKKKNSIKLGRPSPFSSWATTIYGPSGPNTFLSPPYLSSFWSLDGCSIAASGVPPPRSSPIGGGGGGEAKVSVHVLGWTPRRGRSTEREAIFWLGFASPPPNLFPFAPIIISDSTCLFGSIDFFFSCNVRN